MYAIYNVHTKLYHELVKMKESVYVRVSAVMPVWFTWYIRTTTMGSSAKTFRESTALGMTVWRGIEERREDKLACGHWEQSASNNDKGTCASNGKKLCRQYTFKNRGGGEGGGEKLIKRQTVFSLQGGWGVVRSSCRKKYKFEEAERGREEEWWGCLLALLPAQRWYMGEGVGSGRKQNTTDQSACSYWFHTSSTNCSY